MSPELLKKFENVPRNPTKFGKWLARWVGRHDQIGQISYAAQRMSWSTTNYPGTRPPRKGEFTIEVDVRNDGQGLSRSISYFKEIEGNPYTRQVNILSNNSNKVMDTDGIVVSDVPLTSEGEARSFSYSIVDEGLAGESELPFTEVEEEITNVYKQAKEEYWGAAGPPGG